MTRPTRAEIAEQERCLLERQGHFRLAADRMAGALAAHSFVDRVSLIGSVAAPLSREVPRFVPYRRFGIEIVHECSDLDLAVWVSSLDNLAALRRTRISVTQRLLGEAGIGIADHQIEMFLITTGSRDRYLGRVCRFKCCPAGKPACQVEACGAQPFLQQHEGFAFRLATLDVGACVTLFDRAEGGIVARAADLPLVISDRGVGSRPR